MDFFGHQVQAQRRTALLLGLYFSAIVAVVGMLYGLALAILPHPAGVSGWYWDLDLLLVVAALAFATIGAGSFYAVTKFARNGVSVAVALGGVPVEPRTAEERQLLNVVAEMGLAAGVPLPQVYRLGDEPGLNACAAGLGFDDAVIIVTQGLLEALDRDEMQGVIAHEFSHILAGDIRLNLRLAAVLHGISLFYFAGRGLLGHRRGSTRNRGAAGIGAGLMAIGVVGGVAARLIQAAVCRQREWLADAAAVQFTRNVEGLALALCKIGGVDLHFGSRLRTPRATSFSHMFVAPVGAQDLRATAQHWWSTHPPLPARIRRLWPHWDGRMVRAGVAGNGVQVKGQAPASASGWSPEAVVAAAGTLNLAALRVVQSRMRQLPSVVSMACTDVEGARALVYALLLSPDPECRQRQKARLRAQEPPMVVEQMEALSVDAAQFSGLELETAELALPALRQMPAPEYPAFRNRLVTLAAMDGETSLIEHALVARVTGSLERSLRLHRGPVRETQGMAASADAVVVLLGHLVALGGRDHESRAGAWRAAYRHLPLDMPEPGVELRVRPGASLVGALNQLARLSPTDKRQLLTAAVAAAVHDHALDGAEARVLRAFASAVAVPLPADLSFVP